MEPEVLKAYGVDGDSQAKLLELRSYIFEGLGSAAFFKVLG